MVEVAVQCGPEQPGGQQGPREAVWAGDAGAWRA